MLGSGSHTYFNFSAIPIFLNLVPTPDTETLVRWYSEFFLTNILNNSKLYITYICMLQLSILNTPIHIYFSKNTFKTILSA